MTQSRVSFVKTLLIVACVSALSYIGDANHLSSVLNPYTATLVAALASSLESYIKEKTGNAFFGAVTVK